MIEETRFGFGDGRMLLHPYTIEFDISVRCWGQSLKHFAVTAQCVVWFIAVVSLSAIKNAYMRKRKVLTVLMGLIGQLLHERYSSRMKGRKRLGLGIHPA